MRNKAVQQMEGLSQGPSLIDRTYAAILGAIRDGRLPPGERLNQDGLAARLAISRQPVGQALTILKSQGFVRDNGRRGLVVAGLEPDFIRSIYQLREALDPLAARLAAERCTEADALEARKRVAQGRKAARAGALEPLIEADMQLHMWIYRVAGNPLLVQTMDLYWNHLRRAMLQARSHRAAAWDEHAALIEAIAAHQPAAAAALALAHTRGASERGAPAR